MMVRTDRCIPDTLQMAALAHDLRTPMCVAAGAAQMALEAGGRDVSANLRQILQAVSAMDRMLAMMSADESSASFTGEMLQEELAAMTEGKAQQKGQNLSIDLSALDGWMLEADYAALCRLLTNLLCNAVKYTQEGGEITLRAQLLMPPWRSRTAWLRLIIADNGMGMKKAFMRRMYTPHARAEESAHLPGKGLGLAIVKRLIREMRGTIHVKSQWQKGTVFTVTVPVTRR
ncbi:MAG: HAMP domain-containing histidine kinase [Clostridia bacterium]|nr:HAMP domain-containing histidine kinase [Clostridia bacterium]